ncbi:hypothetical protein CVT25_014878 [Psilocybe cyanescens]|uniref:Mitochondrial K+-H+ exchange-related-domain-containing protein n=1 Tax=Psilocybe cyanescens TaxID=93625 RepID=A0A409WEY1_PSICY|nr:hypothetical protein CVT25_014878 [Psilocybe cyanescens]
MTSSLQKMRIIAIPLTRPNARLPSVAAVKTNRLTYYQFQMPERAPNSTTSKAETGGTKGAGSKKRGWLPEEGVANWATQRATRIWSDFGKAEGGWKLKTYQVGQKLMDRTEFEELALKSFDPSMGPSIANIKQRHVLDGKENTSIPLIFPPSQMAPSEVLSELRAYTDFRITRHRRGFYFWMVVIPFTAPLKLIPIIPNLPFFFSAWRAWSHYKAYKSSQYLKSLLDQDLIVPEASKELDEVYMRPQISSVSTTMSSSSSTNNSWSQPPPESPPNQQSYSRHNLLLNHDDVPRIVSLFHLKANSNAAADLNRAIDQTRSRVS